MSYHKLLAEYMEQGRFACLTYEERTACAEALRAFPTEGRAPSINAETYTLAKRMLGRSTRPAVFEMHQIAQAVIDLSEQLAASSPQKTHVEWPQHAEVGLLFTKDAIYVDTGDKHPVCGNMAYKVKDEQAKPILAAMRERK